MEKTRGRFGSDLFFVITGCSGGGKSTLLEALDRHGHATVPEAGRQVVQAQLALGEDGLPWKDVERFGELCVERGMRSYQAASGLTFFDRSILDNLCALDLLGCPRPDQDDLVGRYRYGTLVFYAPPWPDIYETDAERRHGFKEAVIEARALRSFYVGHGYHLIDLPTSPVEERVAFVEAHLPEEDKS